MSHLRPSAVIEGLYLTTDPGDFYTVPVDALHFDVDPNGITYDSRHTGNTILADVRAPAYTRHVDTVLNRQSVSFVSGEDLDYIAQELALDPEYLIGRFGESGNEDPQHATRSFLAQCLGANILLSNFSATDDVAAFRELIPCTDFGPYNPETKKFTDVTVMITRANAPCMPPGKVIQTMYPLSDPDMAQRFVRVAEGRRGFVGMVVKAGKMSVGQQVAFVPFGMK